jgi:hypothetical protein
MDVIKLFRILILASFALLALSLLFFWGAEEPPEPVAAWLGSEAAGPLFSAISDESLFGQVLTLVMALVFIGAYVASLVGMLGYRAWARMVFIGVTVLGFALIPFSGSSLASPMESTFDTLLSACDGALLALLLTEPVAGRFRADPGTG